MEVSREIGVRAARVHACDASGSCAKSGASKPSGGSPLQVSDSAKQLSELVRLVQASNEVRPEKVGPIKQMVESGQYQVDLEKVAERMADEF